MDKGAFKQVWFVSETQRESLDFEKYHSHTFTVTHVVDGDTIDIDYPDKKDRYTRIRLIGIDTPEIYSESGPMYFGAEASDFVKRTAQGKEVTVYLDEGNDTRDKYGRLLAYIRLQDGIFLNEIILSEGYAYAYTKFRHSFYNKYKQLESHAKSGKKGLWKNVTPEQMPSWRQENSETSE